ncbi:MAG: GNAT family N-acetyltransferase [Aeromonadaceae bacterium]
MTPQDYPAVIALWQQSEGLTLRDADSEAAIRAYLARNPGLSFVAHDRHQLIGSVLVGSDGRRGYLQHLSVAKEWQGKGVGRALLQAAIQALHAIGVEKTHLFVHAENHEAQAFYRHLGWQERADIQLYSFNASTNHNA